MGGSRRPSWLQCFVLSSSWQKNKASPALDSSLQLGRGREETEASNCWALAKAAQLTWAELGVGGEICGHYSSALCTADAWPPCMRVGSSCGYLWGLFSALQPLISVPHVSALVSLMWFN